MKTVGSYAAKNHLSKILREVAMRGEEYVIQRRGRNVARLTPCRRLGTGASPNQAMEVIESLRRFRENFKTGPRLDVKAAIAWGRK